MADNPESPIYALFSVCEQFSQKGSWLAREGQTIEDYELLIRLSAARLVEAENLKYDDLFPAYKAMIARNRLAAGLPSIAL